MATQKFVQAQEFKLAGSGVTSTATSIELVSFNMPNGDAIVQADLGTTNYMVLEPGTANEEIISFTTITSVTISGAVRGLDFASPYTTVAGNKKAHAGGTIAILTNSPQLYQDLASNVDDQTFLGVVTFTAPNYPEMSSVASAPTDDEQLASKKYVDDVGAGGTLSKNRTVIAGTAGETLTTGQGVYFNVTDKEWKKWDASAAATCENVLLGIAQGAGTNGAAISGGVLLNGLDENQTGLTAGTKYYISDTGGAISTSAGTVEVSVGFANSGSTTTLIFQPRYDQQITEDIQDALAGSSGTPSSTNKYVTADDVSNAAASAKIVRATGTSLPALAATNLTSLPVANLLVASQAAGDTIYATSTTVWVRLAKGAGGKTYKMNSGGTAPEWADAITFVNGEALLAGDTASGNQNIAHGLGVAPKYVRLVCRWLIANNNPNDNFSDGVYNGTTSSCVYMGGVVGSATRESDTTSGIAHLREDNGKTQAATVTVDATNIILAWTRTGATSGANIEMIWEARV